MGETNVILEYRRANDCWLCPECDAENQLTQASCAVCGYRQMGSVAIVRAWTEQDNRPPENGYAGGAPFNSYYPPAGGISHPDDMRSSVSAGSEESSAGKIVLWTVAIIAVIIFICFVAYALS